ncbi:anti-sigma factor [Mesorhizobium sp. L-8-10]|uniref:anti-sigma factor family protein n=1 Tax=unclassified Mesorhizobium TaxID=325217 RepID=UPI0019270E76|nr:MULTISPECIES: anti-sigma factor [unclassified Mesorhizobium]BCH25881.1 anti-sigma factor [Mesorhizobium sp. L-8-3]BCH33865.1 anti-sigma factor [Mesorhizobium sp. L-8-10]
MTGRPFSERDIHLALDGELPPEERADFEAWLEADSDMKAKYSRFADDAARLRDTLAGVLDEAVPDRLSGLLSAGGIGAETASNPGRKAIVDDRRARWWGDWRAAAAAVLMLLAGGVGGYLIGTRQDRAESRLAEQAVGAYLTYAVDQPRAVEVDAGDKLRLDGWLSKRVGLKLVAPDLSAQGFELLGGRILPYDDKVAALLVYKNAAGKQISLYVTATKEDGIRGTYAQEAGGPSAVYWLDKGFGCAVVGALPSDELAEVARNAWRQLVEGAAT